MSNHHFSPKHSIYLFGYCKLKCVFAHFLFTLFTLSLFKPCLIYRFCLCGKALDSLCSSWIKTAWPGTREICKQTALAGHGHLTRFCQGTYSFLLFQAHQAAEAARQSGATNGQTQRQPENFILPAARAGNVSTHVAPKCIRAEPNK